MYAGLFYCGETLSDHSRSFFFGKGKAVPLHAIEAPGGGGGDSSYSFLTSALEGDEWSASRSGRTLHPVPIVQETGWAPEPVWTQRRK
jgi:hypothetical protein